MEYVHEEQWNEFERNDGCGFIQNECEAECILILVSLMRFCAPYLRRILKGAVVASISVIGSDLPLARAARATLCLADTPDVAVVRDRERAHLDGDGGAVLTRQRHAKLWARAAPRALLVLAEEVEGAHDIEH